MKILILDDEPLELEQLEMLIHHHFPTWQIEKAANATEALNVIQYASSKREEFQLALIDIRLPGQNGLDVAAKIKHVMPNIDFIVISAFQEFNYAKQSIQLKVVDYLVKPVIESELLAILQKYLQEHPEYQINSEVIRKVLEMVKNRYQDTLKLADVAQELHINPNYLSRLFSEEMGISFSDYVLAFRIDLAKKLLVKNKNWSIQRVAEETGFNTQHYFSSVFKKLTNQTPKDFRQNHSL